MQGVLERTNLPEMDMLCCTKCFCFCISCAIYKSVQPFIKTAANDLKLEFYRIFRNKISFKKIHLCKTC